MELCFNINLLQNTTNDKLLVQKMKWKLCKINGDFIVYITTQNYKF